jgi:hypothetical protein
MIAITEDKQIDRDGEIIGQIVDGIAWLKSKQAPRILGQIRTATGMDNLSFEVVETPTVNESLTVQPISTPEVLDTPPALEPVAVCDDAAAGTPSYDLTGFGEIGSPYFKRCFVNHYGPSAYAAFCKVNGI